MQPKSRGPSPTRSATAAPATRRAAHQLPQLDPAELDRPIAKAQGEPADSDATLQEAAPNYPQLVKQVMRAADVPARSNVSHLQNAMLSQEAEQR